jgi:hypothetical protein
MDLTITVFIFVYIPFVLAGQLSNLKQTPGNNTHKTETQFKFIWQCEDVPRAHSAA